MSATSKTRQSTSRPRAPSPARTGSLCPLLWHRMGLREKLRQLRPMPVGDLRRRFHMPTLVVFFICASPFAAVSQEGDADSAADLGMALNNPVADLISVPLQFNFDQNHNPDDAGKITTLNIQPVIPFSISANWNLISRTIVPLKWSNDFPAADFGSDFGYGDIVQSFFFSPKPLAANGWIWGAGPVFVLPLSRANDEPFYGAGEWAGGLTAVALKQQNGWTYGGLINHVANFGASHDVDINATFLQPFVAFTTPQAWTFALNTESTYDWDAKQWIVPINASFSKVVTIGSQAVSFQLGARYHADGPDSAPEGWGLRFNTTFLFPK